MMTQVFPIQSIGRAARVSLLSVAAFTGSWPLLCGRPARFIPWS